MIYKGERSKYSIFMERPLKIGSNWIRVFHHLKIRQINLTWDDYIVGVVSQTRNGYSGQCRHGNGIFSLTNQFDQIRGYVLLQNYGLKEVFDPFKKSLDYIQKKNPFYVDYHFSESYKETPIKISKSQLSTLCSFYSPSLQSDSCRVLAKNTLRSTSPFQNPRRKLGLENRGGLS